MNTQTYILHYKHTHTVPSVPQDPSIHHLKSQMTTQERAGQVFTIRTSSPQKCLQIQIQTHTHTLNLNHRTDVQHLFTSNYIAATLLCVHSEYLMGTHRHPSFLLRSSISPTCAPRSSPQRLHSHRNYRPELPPTRSNTRPRDTEVTSAKPGPQIPGRDPGPASADPRPRGP